ncbi:MAG: RpiB/LacA/LacB family sugar-phosphate isomerase [Candidatus Paceibacterota bacterium]
MKVVFACDHAGFELKQSLLAYVTSKGYEVEDMGAYEFVANDDYPDYIALASRIVSENPNETLGIIIGGSGQGEAIMANRFPNVRAVVFNGQYKPTDGRIVPFEVMTAREHNNANILSLGARFINEEEAIQAVDAFLTTRFSGDERHIRRLGKIEEVTKTIHG